MSTTKAVLTVIGIVAVIMVVVTGGWALKAGMLPFMTVTTQIDSAGQVIDKTYDADNAIYNYEWFKTQHEDIQATERIISNTKIQMGNYKEMYGNASEWDWQTRQDYTSLSGKFLGQQNYYENLVAEYNARSKMANREIFKDKLPLHVDKVLW
ncbi:MAG: hypothetical protein U9Q37_02835 [Euryarchaeota archaeon]|nr:hypothetical protein [Euryarchaeota archaeon]